LALVARSARRCASRNKAAAPHAAEHFAAVIEQAGDARALEACEIILHRALALRCEQADKIALHELGAVIAEQRFGAAVTRVEVAFGIEHHDAVGGRIEDGAEFFGVGVADRGWCRQGRGGA
jgi:hypothetical protein